MLTRNDQPLGMSFSLATDGNFDFAVDSIFTNVVGDSSGIVDNEFLLLTNVPFLLLNGQDMLLLT